LEQLLLGNLTGPQADELEAHVAACPHCVATAQTLHPEDAIVRALHGSDREATPPQQDMIDAIIPLLKRIRSHDETKTFAPHGSTSELLGDTTPGPSGALTPVDLPGVIGTIGPYHVLRQLGVGGMGVVYLAQDPKLGRQIALKVIRPELVSRTDLHRRFLNEARAVAKVEHDHIVAIFHVDEHEGAPYLAMPLLRGQTLEDRLRQADGPLPVDEILCIGREIAEGLAAAHERGLVHRDVKPNNIFLEVGAREGADDPSCLAPRVKILDFGLARAVQAEDGLGVDQTITGTPAYMAPEQGRGEKADARCDLFSLGCVLYRMATGRHAFGGSDVVAVLLNVALEQPPPVGQLNLEVPPELGELIELLMAKRPGERPASARVVADALRAMDERRAYRPWRSPRRWLMVSAAAVLLAVGLTYWLVPPTLIAPLPPEPGQVTFAFDVTDGVLSLQGADELERSIDLKWLRTRALPPGEYRVRYSVKSPGRRLDPDHILVKPGEITTVSLRLVGEVRRHALHERPVRGVALSPVPGSLLALSASDDRTLVAWDAALMEVKPWTVGRHDDGVHCVAFSHDGARAASGSGGKGPRVRDFSIRLWDIHNRRELPSLPGHDRTATCVAFAPDGLRLISGASNGTVYFWDLKKNETVRRLEGHDPRTCGVDFSADGKQALSCGADKTIVLWDPADGKLVRRLQGHTESVSAAVFAPEGQRIASAGWDGIVGVWDLTTGALHKLKGHNGEVECVAWSRDGKRLLSGGRDSTVRLWDVQTEAQLECFKGHTKTVHGVAFSADGRYALSGSADCSVRLWELPE
jgi:WD40 repeat protein/serine/threonine protein kinase